MLTGEVTTAAAPDAAPEVRADPDAAGGDPQCGRAGIPARPVAVPEAIGALARGARLTPVWRNELGGLTFATDDGRYLKHGPRNAETSMAAEAERLTWAGPFTTVPRVLEVGGDDETEWMATTALPGRSAVAPRWIADPARAVHAVGAGLRALHDALPVDPCPFVWSVDARIARAAERGIRVPRELHEPPPIDLLVVCHGDACCPNTILGDDGAVTGHVDLGALGVADRWADLAVAAMSTRWNYGPGWEDALVAAYGIEPDRDRLEYYRDLWNAT